MVRFLLINLLFFSFGFCKSSCFTIFSFNDSSHFTDPKSLPKIMTLLEQERRKSLYHITLVNADLTFEKIIPIFNQMKVDFACFHLQAPGLVQKKISASNFNWLASNLVNQKGECAVKDIHVFQQDQIKIGLFGLVNERSAKDWGSTCPFYIAEQKILELKKQQVDVMILVSSLTLEEDRILAKRYPEIDLIIGYHDKAPMSWFEDQTFIHRSSSHSSDVVRIDIQVEKKQTPWRTKTQVYPVWKVISEENIELDPMVSKMVNLLEK